MAPTVALGKRVAPAPLPRPPREQRLVREIITTTTVDRRFLPEGEQDAEPNAVEVEPPVAASPPPTGLPSMAQRSRAEVTMLAHVMYAAAGALTEDEIFQALLEGDAHTVSGFMNKVQDMFAGVIPDTVLAQMHRRMAEPDDR